MTKGRNIKNFIKSQPLFDVHRQYLQTFLIDLRAEVLRFRRFAYFLKIYLDYNSFLSNISYPPMIVLHLASFANNLFESDFSIFKKNVFLQSNLLRKVNLLRGYEIFSSRFLLFSIYQNTSESIRPYFRKKKLAP